MDLLKIRKGEWQPTLVHCIFKSLSWYIPAYLLTMLSQYLMMMAGKESRMLVGIFGLLNRIFIK
jgi:hypothetical protein